MILGEALMVALIGGALGIALGAGLIQAASLSPAVGGFLSGTLDPTSSRRRSSPQECSALSQAVLHDDGIPEELHRIAPQLQAMLERV